MSDEKVVGIEVTFERLQKTYPVPSDLRMMGKWELAEHKRTGTWSCLSRGQPDTGNFTFLGHSDVFFWSGSCIT